MLRKLSDLYVEHRGLFYYGPDHSRFAIRGQRFGMLETVDYLALCAYALRQQTSWQGTQN